MPGPLRCSSSGVIRSSILVLLAVLPGCTTTRVLDARFDGDAAGKPPSAPQPDPPGDNFIWTVNNKVASTLVARPGGGQWVRIAPLPTFFPAPDNTRKEAMLALSAPLTAGSKSVRGGVDLNISGHAAVIFAVEGVHGPSQTRTNLGGVRVVFNGLAPGSTGTVTSNGLDAITGPFNLPGTGIGPYQAGQTVQVSWSIDQAAHAITINTFPGGTSQTMNYPVATQGVATTPLSRIGLDIFLEDPAMGASVFVDNLSVEEF